MRAGRFELIDQRVLAALSFVDAVSNLPIDDLFDLAGVRAVRSSAGLYVLLAPNPTDDRLYAYLDGFRKASGAPPPGKVTLHMRAAAPGGRYLARRFSLKVPLQLADKTASDYLLNPVAIAMYPSATRPIEASWAVLRLKVEQHGERPVPLGGVLLRVFSTPASPADQPALLGAGLSDARGEALLVVPRLRVLTFSAPEVKVAVRAIRDTRLDGVPDSLPDPDELLTAAEDAAWLAKAEKTKITIAPGRITADTITMP